MLAVGLSAGCVELFDPITGVQLWDTHAFAPAGGTCAKVSPSGAFVGSVVHPGTRAPSTPTQRWQMRDTVSGTVLHDVPTPDGTVGLYTLEFSPCKRWIAAAGDDHRVLVWDLPIGNEVRILETASSYVFSLSFSGDGTLLAAATHAGMTSIWDTATWTQTKYWAGGANVCFSPTNRNLLATTSGDEVFGCKLWDISTHTVVWVFPEADTFAVFSHDGRTLATTIDEEVQSDTSEGADEPGNLLVVCTSTGGTIWLLTGHTEYLTCASFSVRPQPRPRKSQVQPFPLVLSARSKFLHPNRQPDDTKVVSGSVDTTCKVWDLLTGTLLHTINTGTDVCTVSWGRDWVRDLQRREAFAMGSTPRLGIGSLVRALDEGVVRMVLDRGM